MRGSSGSFTMLLIVVLGLVVAGIAVIVVLGRRGGVRRPSCGSCGYAVAGLDGLTCPECGADLRDVGIETPAGARSPWVVPFAIAVLWSIGIAIVASIVTPLVHRAFPRPYSTTATWTFTPAEVEFDTVTIDFSGTGSSQGLAFQQGMIVEGSAKARLPGRTDGDALKFAVPDLTIAGTGETLDERTIATWLVDDESERPEVKVDQAARELLAHVKAGATPGGAMVIQGPAIYAGGTVNSIHRRGPEPKWLVPLVGVGWGVVWLAGLWFIRRRYRADAKPR